MVMYGDVDIGYDDDNNAASPAGKYVLLVPLEYPPVPHQFAIESGHLVR